MKIQTMPLERRVGIAGRHRITCGSPAREEKDAFVTGNGTLALSAFGCPQDDTITLTHEAFYSPQWKEAPKAPNIADYLPLVRELMLNGEYTKAADLAANAVKMRGPGTTLASAPRHPAMLLQLHQAVERAEDYLNVLDMRTSLVTTQWHSEGVRYTREMFCSRADQLAAIRLRAPDGHLALTVKGAFPQIEYKPSGWGANYLPINDRGTYETNPVPPDVAASHTMDGILLRGTYAYDRGGFDVAASFRLSGGTLAVHGGELRIEGADELVILIRASLRSATEHSRAEQMMADLGTISDSFDALHARHVAIHKPIFDRLSVSLGGPDEDYLKTTLELKRQQFSSPHIVPAYMEAMVDMGRFFLMNECGQFPPIHGHVNVNINHQISGGNIGALPEMMESFFRWIEWQLDDARENAQRILGTRGFLLATHPDTESGRLYHTSKYWPHHYWISSSGWCLQPFLEHYYCTGDEAFLQKRALPLYYELSQLYEDFLTVRDAEGKLMFCPSYSPENYPSNIPCMSVINATMDISICREVFTTLITYGPGAGIGTQQDLDRWQSILDNMPPYLLDEHGELKEWSRADHEERYDHRHASHLYGAYPGDEFQPELDEALHRAAYAANRMRALGNESCHGVMHRAQSAARLKDSYLVQSLLRFVLESGYINENFTTVHNPYFKHAMPDGQGALPTVLLESLLYARPGFIEPLPARPEGCFIKGCIRGLRARSFALIDELSWDLERGEIHLQITSIKDQTITLCHRAEYDSATVNGTPAEQLDASHITLRVRGGETVLVQWQGVKSALL